MPGIRGVVRRGLHPEDDRGGYYLQVVAAGAGAMPGVWEWVGKGFTGVAPTNPVRRGKMGVGIRGRKVRQGKRSENLHIGVSCEVRP